MAANLTVLYSVLLNCSSLTAFFPPDFRPNALEVRHYEKEELRVREHSYTLSSNGSAVENQLYEINGGQFTGNVTSNIWTYPNGSIFVTCFGWTKYPHIELMSLLQAHDNLLTPLCSSGPAFEEAYYFGSYMWLYRTSRANPGVEVARTCEDKEDNVVLPNGYKDLTFRSDINYVFFEDNGKCRQAKNTAESVVKNETTDVTLKFEDCSVLPFEVYEREGKQETVYFSLKHLLRTSQCSLDNQELDPDNIHIKFIHNGAPPTTTTTTRCDWLSDPLFFRQSDIRPQRLKEDDDFVIHAAVRDCLL
uniref:ZP domain-containing protein n=1 Tax=Bursaphelenchus xylophilus TaxID=6326 RepID=A0A1I7S8D1_BURXY